MGTVDCVYSPTVNKEPFPSFGIPPITMSNQLNDLLTRSRPSNDDVPLRVVEMDDDEAVEIFETLGSETTYLIYKQLHEEP